jgi:hypothetical protein
MTPSGTFGLTDLRGYSSAFHCDMPTARKHISLFLQNMTVEVGKIINLHRVGS